MGSTAFFQRGMDIIGTAILSMAGIPIIILGAGYVDLLKKRWFPTSGVDYAGFITGLVLLILISVYLIHSVSEYGWTKERVYIDTIKYTEDEKYEYRIELVNLFQRNSYARLYLKDAITKEEMHIPVDIKTRGIRGLAVGKENHWVRLEATNHPSQYILYPESRLDVPFEKFLIDIETRTSKLLE